MFGSLVAACCQDAKDLHLKLVESQNKEAAVTQELLDARDKQQTFQAAAETAWKDLLQAQAENAELLLVLRSKLGISMNM